MGNEIGQPDIPGIQLRESRTQPKVSHSREIGEAEIIHTIFGKAKVRIIRKHDKLRHVLLLTATFGVAATSTFVVQSWYVAQQQETARRENPMAPVSVAQDAQPENAAASAIPSTAVLESAAPPPKPVLPSVPQPQVVKPVPAPVPVPVPVPVPPKPVVVRPPVAAPVKVVAPPTAPVAQTPTPAAAMKAPPVAPPAVKPALPKPLAASAVAAPTEAKPAVQPAASIPAASPALDAPVIKDGSSEVDNHLSAPINVQNN